MKISIVTATWNSGKTVEDTIKSVLQQRYTNIEHIIKDGYSKDNTIQICEFYKNRLNTSIEEISYKGKNIIVISCKDKGIYDAMNKGVQMASGDVIGILNSDDFFTSDDVLVRVAKEFELNPELEAIYGDIHFVAADATLANPGKCTRYYSSAMFRPWLLRFGFMPAHPSFYVRREVYEKYGLYDLDFRTSSDFEMMVRLFGKNKIKSKYIPMDFVTMRAGGESTAGMEAKKKVNRDIASSLKKHGIFTCQAFQWLRYMWKAIELIYTRLRY